MAAQRRSATKWMARAAIPHPKTRAPRRSPAPFQNGIRRRGIASAILPGEGALPAALEEGLEVGPGCRVDGIGCQILQLLGVGDLVVELHARGASVPFGVAPEFRADA